MIYIDPPYGIKFGSNFQPSVGKRDVKDKDERPHPRARDGQGIPRHVGAGLHSYLTYLRDRLILRANS